VDSDPLTQARGVAAPAPAVAVGRKARRTTKRGGRRAVIQLGIGMAIIVGALSFLAYQGLAHNLVYYITPSELLAKGASAQGQGFTLGGQVKPDSQSWNRRTHALTFVLRDPKAAVRVVSTRLPPPLFASGIGAVVQGTYRNGVFRASTVLIKHSSTYVAPKPGQLPQNDQFVNNK
jgi:cytochrome c-type biogenesis protein CcmE